MLAPHFESLISVRGDKPPNAFCVNRAFSDAWWSRQDATPVWLTKRDQWGSASRGTTDVRQAPDLICPWLCLRRKTGRNGGSMKQDGFNSVHYRESGQPSRADGWRSDKFKPGLDHPKSETKPGGWKTLAIAYGSLLFRETIHFKEFNPLPSHP